MEAPTQPPASDGAGVAIGGNQVDIHKPFTKAERIQQLGEIDKDIASLLVHASEAMKAVAKIPAAQQPPPGAANNNDDDDGAADAVANFTAAQTEFIDKLDRIDKLLKRQIYALEEAGIITLRTSAEPAIIETAGAGAEGRVKIIPSRLEPDGMGKWGKFDVGFLNMSGNTVERDMEGELWSKAKEHLAAAVAEKTADRMQE
ncbi:mediator complex protein-domain-containing protein [Lasiosphaeria miniovina]|uniref:Mediator of RNA polymerase II transcription subunit 11 n=1 Tax=Lasiosphaeria miniovina TaxID=1954250 RepID=A0AA40B4K9_9PEZI|nr:mediator complex protein-domain-containing protein [Lasiosphaeria miniovina]KAK0727427.1 mediator complex protein-domain-containing protein [Lasiosphaeria miniovina]